MSNVKNPVKTDNFVVDLFVGQHPLAINRQLLQMIDKGNNLITKRIL